MWLSGKQIESVSRRQCGIWPVKAAEGWCAAETCQQPSETDPHGPGQFNEAKRDVISFLEAKCLSLS